MGMLPGEARVQIPFDDNRSLPGALWKRSDKDDKGGGVGVLLLHPHPTYGGDMNNPIILLSAHSMHTNEPGVAATLRFDYGKNGLSQNVVLPEVEAAMAFLRKEAGVRTVSLLVL